MRNIAVSMIGIALMIITALLTYSSVTALYEAKEAKQTAHAACLEAQNASLQAELAEQTEIIEGINLKPLGEFEVTFYCYNSGYTASGTVPDDMTVAVNTDEIPLGSLIYVEGMGFRIAEDTGGFGDRTIDIYLPDYDECIERGRLEGVKVWLVQ